MWGLQKAVLTLHAMSTNTHCLKLMTCLHAWQAARYTKIDLSQAYLQLTVDEESQCVNTINTIKGSFRVKMLPFDPATRKFVKHEILRPLHFRDDQELNKQTASKISHFIPRYGENSIA